MNFKKQAEKLESLLEEELKKIPLIVISDTVLAYKNYKIKKNKAGFWSLYNPHGDLVYKFRMKTTAILAAKFYERTNLQKYNEVKILDSQYWHSKSDASLFEYRYKNTKNTDKIEIYLCRWELAKQRSMWLKDEISSMFKTNF